MTFEMLFSLSGKIPRWAKVG